MLNLIVRNFNIFVILIVWIVLFVFITVNPKVEFETFPIFKLKLTHETNFHKSRI